jgi:putative oxidoreductase
MNSGMSAVAAVGRFLLALIFVRAGINKLGAIAATTANMANHGIPMPDLIIYGVIALELGGGLMMMAGLFTRWVAAAFFLYITTLAVLFHGYWNVADAAAARTDASFFFGHLSMMGGMLGFVAFGAGAFSIDALMGWWTADQATASGVAHS